MRVWCKFITVHKYVCFWFKMKVFKFLVTKMCERYRNAWGISEDCFKTFKKNRCIYTQQHHSSIRSQRAKTLLQKHGNSTKEFDQFPRCFRIHPLAIGVPATRHIWLFWSPNARNPTFSGQLKQCLKDRRWLQYTLKSQPNTPQIHFVPDFSITRVASSLYTPSSVSLPSP